MPGTPDPIFGSDPLTGVIAATLSVLVVGNFAYAASRAELSMVGLTGVGAAGYGLFAIGLWAGVRVVFYHLDPMIEPFQFILLILLAGGLLAVQAAIPFFCLLDPVLSRRWSGSRRSARSCFSSFCALAEKRISACPVRFRLCARFHRKPSRPSSA